VASLLRSAYSRKGKYAVRVSRVVSCIHDVLPSLARKMCCSNVVVDVLKSGIHPSKPKRFLTDFIDSGHLWQLLCLAREMPRTIIPQLH
jgi:hypothetical protein